MSRYALLSMLILVTLAISQTRAQTPDEHRQVQRFRDAQARLKNESVTDGDTAHRLNAIGAKLLAPSVRYSKPGLQAHITYLAGLTANIDQKIGLDAIERYDVLRRELDEIRAELDAVLGK